MYNIKVKEGRAVVHNSICYFTNDMLMIVPKKRISLKIRTRL